MKRGFRCCPHPMASSELLGMRELVMFIDGRCLDSGAGAFRSDAGSVTPILTPAFAGGRLFPSRGGRGLLRMPAVPSPQPSP